MFQSFAFAFFHYSGFFSFHSPSLLRVGNFTQAEMGQYSIIPSLFRRPNFPFFC
jgi:hypothetical protein